MRVINKSLNRMHLDCRRAICRLGVCLIEEAVQSLFDWSLFASSDSYLTHITLLSICWSTGVTGTTASVVMSAGIDLVNQPIVIDNGSGTVKAGFAGDQVPKCIFPNFIGRTKHVRVMAGGLEGDVFIGQKAEEHRGLLSLRYPMEHGIVHDWNDMERIWQHIFSKEQLHTFSEEHPILLTGQSSSCNHVLNSYISLLSRSPSQSTTKSRKSGRNLFRDI